jgi:hypothetical protein
VENAFSISKKGADMGPWVARLRSIWQKCDSL